MPVEGQEKVLDLLEMELQAVVCCLRQVLGSELGSAEGTASQGS